MTTDVVPILRVADASRAVAWYRLLGFEQLFEHRFEPHLPAYVGIRRETAQIHLSEHVGDANPHGLVYIWVDDIDAVGVEFGVAVDDQPWGREIDLTDPDGNRVRLAEPVESADDSTTVDDATTTTLFELERSMWTESTRGDRSWMDEHLTETFTEFGWSGRRYTRADILENEVGPIEVELSDMEVRAVAPDAALVTYRSIEPRGVGHRASLWIRRRGEWLLDFHQGTPAG